MRAQKNLVYLNISGFPFEPERITAALSIKPTKIWRIGERSHGNVGVFLKENAWRLQSTLNPKTATIEKQLQNLLGTIAGKEKKIQKLAEKYYGEITIIVYTEEANPGLHIGREVLKKISKMSLELDMDLYCLGEEDSW